MMFHVKDGLYFERLSDGNVRVLKRRDGKPDSAVVFDMIIDRDSWCSIIASMSYYGEEDYGWYRACNFHNGTHLDPVTTPLADKKPLW
jgi:hypothetical protein